MITATVSHEMRTPLNSIISMITVIEPFINNEKATKNLSIVGSSAKMMLYLVNDMLDLY
jgi:signal transduction histidine kinase